MKVIITVECDNAAFEERAGDEVAVILAKLATRFSAWGDDIETMDRFPVRDSNGNTVGKVEVRE